MPQLSSVIRYVTYVLANGVKTKPTLQVKENGKWVDVVCNEERLDGSAERGGQ